MFSSKLRLPENEWVPEFERVLEFILWHPFKRVARECACISMCGCVEPIRPKPDYRINKKHMTE